MRVPLHNVLAALLDLLLVLRAVEAAGAGARPAERPGGEAVTVELEAHALLTATGPAAGCRHVHEWSNGKDSVRRTGQHMGKAEARRRYWLK